MLERLLINVDVGLPGAVLRTALGFLLLPTLRGLGWDPGPAMAVVALLALLFAVKVVAAVARRLVPATAVVRAHWAWRRDLARNHDSYQWRKLVWIGVGLLLGAALGVPGTRVQWVLGAACLAAGGAAEAFWRRQGIGLAPPAAP